MLFYSLYDEVLDLYFRLKRISDYIVIQAEFKRTQFQSTKLLTWFHKILKSIKVSTENYIYTYLNLKRGLNKFKIHQLYLCLLIITDLKHKLSETTFHK